MNSKSKMTTQELGKEIRAQRKRLGMNQSELAMVAGTGVRFIGDLENPKPKLRAWQDAFGSDGSRA